MAEEARNTETFIKVSRVLESYKLLDDTGHIINCGYTEESPICNCSLFGRDLLEAITSQNLHGL